MKQPDLPHIVSRLFQTPHMVELGKLDIILTAIQTRLFEGGKFPHHGGLDVSGDDKEELPPEAYRIRQSVAIIPVYGTLVRRGGWLGAMSGLSSYEGLLASLTAAMQDQAVKAILLDIDSGGGEAGGVFDLVEMFKNLARTYQKPIWAHANEYACSAAYAIACAAEKIWVARTGSVGSIGVVCAHMDQSKADEKAGIKWTYIFEGDHKTHGNPHEPIVDAALEKIQEDCHYLYEMFVALVANSRSMTCDNIRATKAETFIGTKAVDLKLADCVGTLEEALQSLAYSVNNKSTNLAVTTKRSNGICQAATDTAPPMRTKNSKMKCQKNKQKIKTRN